MTTSTLTSHQHVAALRHLAAGKTLDDVATILSTTRSTVLDVASKHGYPDREKLAWAADLLAKKLDDDAHTIPERQPDRAPTPIRPAAGASTPPVAGAQLTRPDEIRVLLNTAKGHPAKRIQAQADKVIDAVDRLRALIREDEEKHAARRKAERDRAAARAEVKRLEEQLRAAREKLRGPKPTKPATTRSTPAGDQPSAKEIRSWAAANDVDCPTVGRVPSAVREAYDEAHQQVAS